MPGLTHTFTLSMSPVQRKELSEHVPGPHIAPWLRQVVAAALKDLSEGQPSQKP